MSEIEDLSQQISTIIQDSNEKAALLQQQSNAIKQAMQSLSVMQGTSRANYQIILNRFQITVSKLNVAVESLINVSKMARTWIDTHVARSGGNGLPVADDVDFSVGDEFGGEKPNDNDNNPFVNEFGASMSDTDEQSKTRLHLNIDPSTVLMMRIKPTGTIPRCLDKSAYGFIQESNGNSTYDHPIETASYMYQQQGSANPNYQGTCGLCSVANILRLAGVNIGEKEVVDYASTARLCVRKPIKFFKPGDEKEKSDFDRLWSSRAGGTSPPDIKELLNHYGVKSEMVFLDTNRDKAVDYLAKSVSEGRGVIICVDAYKFDPYHYGDGGHGLVVTSVTKNAEGKVIGFYIVDSNGCGTKFHTVDHIMNSLLPGCPIIVTSQIIR